MIANDDLLDFEDEDTNEESLLDITEGPKPDVKTASVSIHSPGFRDFLLKPQLLRAITEYGFEHPSEVQYECIPQAVLGVDVLCQAKSGIGKTTVLVLTTLQQLETDVNNICYVLVMCHSRELALQIGKKYARFTKYMPGVKVAVFFDALGGEKDMDTLKNGAPHIIVGTPGRVLALIRSKKLTLTHLKHFVLDEYDKMLEHLIIRRDVLEIFHNSSKEKQVMMFSSTLSKSMHPICKKFMQDPIKMYMDTGVNLTLKGLQQHYDYVDRNEKSQRLLELLEVLEFNQVVIFVDSIQRCVALTQLLIGANFSAIGIHDGMTEDERLNRHHKFKDFHKRILVTNKIFGFGIDIEHVNIVFNYDIPNNALSYLHRVARAGRCGTKGLVITFISGDNDAELLNGVQNQYNVNISKLPNEIDLSTYI